MGLLFQNYALFPNMTVEQNILCGLKTERDKAARKARCAGMLREPFAVINADDYWPAAARQSFPADSNSAPRWPVSWWASRRS